MLPEASQIDDFGHSPKYWLLIEPEIDTICQRMDKLITDYYDGIQVAKKEKAENGEEYEEPRQESSLLADRPMSYLSRKTEVMPTVTKVKNAQAAQVDL